MHDLAYQSVLKQLNEMPEFFAKSLSAVPQEILVRKPHRDKLSLIEHLWHVHDCEVELYGLRLRNILELEKPSLEPVDVAEWTRTRNYASRSGHDAIRMFAEHRTNLIQYLTTLNTATLQRVGKRMDGSTISVMEVIEQLAWHDRDHRWRIAAILQEFLLSNA